MEQLTCYCVELKRWNGAYNLVASSTLNRLVAVHLLDSMAVHAYIKGQRILDVGTGAGFPGIPLAILFPQFQFTLLDSNGKKTRFLRQVVNTLGVSNVNIEQGRLEALKNVLIFDQIVTRAFSSVEKLLNLLAQTQITWKEVLMLKGKSPDDELAGISTVGYDVFPLQVPGIDAERHLIYLKHDRLNCNDEP